MLRFEPAICRFVRFYNGVSGKKFGTKVQNCIDKNCVFGTKYKNMYSL